MTAVGTRFPTTMTVLATYRCTAACENCCFGSHAGIREQLPVDRILQHIDAAAALGTVRLIVFSGGETFLLGDDLVTAVARCSEHGIATRIVTNAYWAKTQRQARERLEPLWGAGLHELNISTGDFHQQFVPVERVVSAAVAGIHVGMSVAVVVESRLGRQFTADHLLTQPRFVALKGNPQLKIVESPWMSMHDRAAIEQRSSIRCSRENLHLRRGCDSVLNTIVVTPSEQVGACCGLTREQIPELNLGSLHEHSLADLFERGTHDFMKMWLAVDGPERILAWAASKDPTIQWEHLYSHHCDACRALYDDPRVRRAIFEHWQEVRDDVVFRFSLLSRYGRAPEDAPLLGIRTASAATGSSVQRTRLEDKTS